MDPYPRAPGRSVKLALVAFGLLALLAVVAFASRSGFGHQSGATPTPGYVSYAFTAFLIVFVIAIPVAMYSLLIQAREGTPRRKSLKSRVVANILTFVFFVCLAVVAIYLKRHHGHLFRIDAGALKNANEALHRRSAGRRVPYEPKFEWSLFWIAVAVLVALGSWAFVQFRRRPRRPAKGLVAPSLADDLVASITDAIDDLEAEPDARRAVIAAYARMETALARSGLRRRPSDTPVEYQRRILSGLTTRGEAVGRLTSLFERAKFSRHEIDTPMKLDAIAALREIRDDLQTAPA